MGKQPTWSLKFDQPTYGMTNRIGLSSVMSVDQCLCGALAQLGESNPLRTHGLFVSKNPGPTWNNHNPSYSTSSVQQFQLLQILYTRPTTESIWSSIDTAATARWGSNTHNRVPQLPAGRYDLGNSFHILENPQKSIHVSSSYVSWCSQVSYYRAQNISSCLQFKVKDPHKSRVQQVHTKVVRTKIKFPKKRLPPWYSPQRDLRELIILGSHSSRMFTVYIHWSKEETNLKVG